MSRLDDHFDDNAEVDSETAQKIIRYLTQESDVKANRNIRKITRNMPDSAPLRITELPDYKKIHKSIPPEMIVQNPDVGSLSQCDSCHENAGDGNFDDDDVAIPNFPDWDGNFSVFCAIFSCSSAGGG